MITRKTETIQTILGSLDLQQEMEDLVIDLHALGMEDDIHRPSHLKNHEKQRKENNIGYFLVNNS